MPFYDYKCPARHVNEHVCGMAEVPPTITCPDCGGVASRVFGWGHTIYHGAGTYTNDYRLRYNRKRRPNPGDSLPIPPEAGITRAEGAEFSRHTR